MISNTSVFLIYFKKYIAIPGRVLDSIIKEDGKQLPYAFGITF